LLFAVTGLGLAWFFQHEKERLRIQRIAEANKGVGKPRVGGPFTLRDTNGYTVTNKDLKGRYMLVRLAMA
jgi:protein SCO1